MCSCEMNAALSTSSVYFETLWNSGITLITGKQYVHKCKDLSSYTAWSQGCFTSIEAIIQGKGYQLSFHLLASRQQAKSSEA